ncbi:hypothetical protein OTK01_000303 [Caldicellulosiruptor acetigenus]|uniref:hypothetical protein n=1 Tax=Caldicellulosiruptor acetigenus TaxID=301953 RepID=UPI0022A9DF13|nr:hypothetical protein [Caldicellulosiruptor acetigenus]WAM36530.1 hypothetical protein OTK01_000303 [Caldicellulosiruptor acetigenus]
MIQITRHAIKRYQERVMPSCSDLEAELRILEAATHGVLLSRKGKYRAVQHGKAVLIIYDDANISVVKTVETVNFSGFWKKKRRG